MEILKIFFLKRCEKNYKEEAKKDAKFDNKDAKFDKKDAKKYFQFF